MAVRSPEDVFVFLLSSARQGAEHATKVFHELSDAVDNPEIKEALNARAFVSEKVLDTLDECFKYIDKKPMKAAERLHDVFVEEFRKQLSEIESPEAKRLFILAKAHQLNHIRMGEYAVLIEAADAMGHYGVSLMLASCLADKIAFVERTRHLIRRVIEGKMEMRRAA